MPAPLYGPGWLQKACEKVCRKYAEGKLRLEDGKKLTPAHTAKLIAKIAKLDAAPSTGAVAAVFDRWEEYDFAVFSTGPKAFVKFGKNGNKKLEDLIKERSEQRKAERAAAKPAKAPAKKAAKKAPAAKKAAKKTAAKKAA